MHTSDPRAGGGGGPRPRGLLLRLPEGDRLRRAQEPGRHLLHELPAADAVQHQPVPQGGPWWGPGNSVGILSVDTGVPIFVLPRAPADPPCYAYDRRPCTICPPRKTTTRPRACRWPSRAYSTRCVVAWSFLCFICGEVRVAGDVWVGVQSSVAGRENRPVTQVWGPIQCLGWLMNKHGTALPPPAHPCSCNSRTAQCQPRT